MQGKSEALPEQRRGPVCDRRAVAGGIGGGRHPYSATDQAFHGQQEI